MRVVDERFRKENVAPVWYKRSSYLIILAIIALIIIIVAYDVLFPVVAGPEPYVQPNP
jgi:subtilase family serine protease